MIHLLFHFVYSIICGKDEEYKSYRLSGIKPEKGNEHSHKL